MARIGCNVLNCSHNDAGVCYANRISITGKKLIQVTILVVLHF